MTGSQKQGRFQSALVVSQIAVSLVLLITAALLVRSFWNLMTLNPGLPRKGHRGCLARFLTGSAATIRRRQTTRVDRGAREPLFRNVAEQLRALPQVISTGTSSHVPLDGSSWTLGFRISEEKGDSKFTWVSPGYFETMSKPLLQGRVFDDHDAPSSPLVAIVNQTFVRRYLNGLNPLGRMLRTVAEPNYPTTEYQK